VFAAGIVLVESSIVRIVLHSRHQVAHQREARHIGDPFVGNVNFHARLQHLLPTVVQVCQVSVEGFGIVVRAWWEGMVGIDVAHPLQQTALNSHDPIPHRLNSIVSVRDTQRREGNHLGPVTF